MDELGTLHGSDGSRWVSGTEFPRSKAHLRNHFQVLRAAGRGTFNPQHIPDESGAKSSSAASLAVCFCWWEVLAA